jgi:hypothetical protein
MCPEQKHKLPLTKRTTHKKVTKQKQKTRNYKDGKTTK